MAIITRSWRAVVNWFENGDLLPLIILVSVPHYGHVLAAYDWGPVAAVIGALVDLGHYRTIKAYLNGKGGFWMVVLTAFSLGFHWAFYLTGGAAWYAALFFAAAVPVVIFALSFISKAERLATKAARQAPPAVVSDAPVARLDASPAAPRLPAGSDGASNAATDAALTPAARYAAEHGVSLRTAQRHLKQARDNAPATAAD